MQGVGTRLYPVALIPVAGPLGPGRCWAEARCRAAVEPWKVRMQAQLLAVVEVPQDERVRCMAPCCGHAVYRRVHIVRRDGVLLVYGSTCFAGEFRGQEVLSSLPRFTSHAGRVLSARERALLIANTQQLIEDFEAEQAAELARRKAWAARPPSGTGRAGINEAEPPPYKPSTREISSAERAAAAEEARRRLNAKYSGLNFDSPGFKGLLELETARLLRDRPS